MNGKNFSSKCHIAYNHGNFQHLYTKKLYHYLYHPGHYQTPVATISKGICLQK